MLLGLLCSPSQVSSPTKVETESLKEDAFWAMYALLNEWGDSAQYLPGVYRGHDYYQEMTTLLGNYFLVAPNKETKKEIIYNWIGFPPFRELVYEGFDGICCPEFLKGFPQEREAFWALWDEAFAAYEPEIPIEEEE